VKRRVVPSRSASSHTPGLAALQKELASVNERKERLDVRKERLEELIVKFTGDQEEEEERIWMRMSSSMLRWGTWIDIDIRV
jgi:hypothetical protein